MMQNAATLLTAAIAHHQAGRWEQAACAYAEVTALCPTAVAPWLNLALLWSGLERWEAAVVAYRQALVLAPGNGHAHNDLGRALSALGQCSDAARAFATAARLLPGDALPLANLAAVLLRQGQAEEAERHYRQALSRQPDFVDALSGLGAALMDQDRAEAALAPCRRAVELTPDDGAALNNLANALRLSGRLEAAEPVYARAATLHPGDGDIRFGHATTLLTLGRMREGWAAFEHRAPLDRQRLAPALQALPPWRGEPLQGGRLLLYGEQGFGDVLQFVRYAALLAARGEPLALLVHAPLVRLLRGCLPMPVMAFDTPPPACACSSGLLSLPHLLDIPIPAIPYLRADSDLSVLWGERLAGLGGMKVGLVWGGAPRLHDPAACRLDRRRSVPLAAFAALADIPGVTLVSLQRGPAAAQAEGQAWLFDPMPGVEDFADTAAIIGHLDLVIGVDTSVVHLAGALGKPVWILSRFDGCWRWLRDRDDTPWYPTARLYRQPSPGAWDDVLSRVAAALCELQRISQNAAGKNCPHPFGSLVNPPISF